MKLAKFNTGRIPFIAFEGGYHGMTAGSLGLTSAKSYKEGLLPLVPEVHYSQYAYCYRCAFSDVLLICDEIQSGLGRTGKMFSFEHTGIVPDIVTMSKPLGGLGFPISAIAYKEELNTWPTGKPLGLFEATETIEFLKTKSALSPKGLQYQIAFNVLPHIDVFQEGGYTKEEYETVN